MESNIKLVSIYVATGDLYENVIFNGCKEDFITKIREREFITIIVNKTEIMINPDFIVSLVF